MAEKKYSKPSGIIEEISASKKYKSKKARVAHGIFVIVMLAVMFGVIAGITYGITTKVGLYLNDKDVEESKSHVNISGPVDPNEKTDPLPDNIKDVSDLADVMGKSVVLVQAKTEKTESIFSETITKYENYAGVVVAKDEHNYYILVDDQSIKKDAKISVKAGKAVLAGRYEGSSSALGVALVTVNFDSLKAEEKAQINVLSLATEKPKAGEIVMAIGEPNGQVGSIDAGIITGTDGHKDLSDKCHELMTANMKTYSNGKGFIVDSNGKLCGIMVKDKAEVFSFINIANESEMIEVFVNSGKLPYVGILCENQSSEDISQGELANGVFVKKAIIGSPAETAGVSGGDILISVNNEPVNNTEEYQAKILKFKKGDKVTLKLIRDTEEKEITVEIE